MRIAVREARGTAVERLFVSAIGGRWSMTSRVLRAVAVLFGLTLIECAARQRSPEVRAPVPANPQALRAERDGTIRLSDVTLVADRSLKRGRYELRYRVVGTHQFLEIVEVWPEYPLPRTTWKRKRPVGDFECRWESLGQCADETRVLVASQDGIHRMSWIELAGQGGRCYPETPVR